MKSIEIVCFSICKIDVVAALKQKESKYGQYLKLGGTAGLARPMIEGRVFFCSFWCG